MSWTMQDVDYETMVDLGAWRLAGHLTLEKMGREPYLLSETLHRSGLAYATQHLLIFWGFEAQARSDGSLRRLREGTARKVMALLAGERALMKCCGGRHIEAYTAEMCQPDRDEIRRAYHELKRISDAHGSPLESSARYLQRQQRRVDAILDEHSKTVLDLWRAITTAERDAKKTRQPASYLRNPGMFVLAATQEQRS